MNFKSSFILKSSFITLIILFSYFGKTQNVGFGTDTPQYKADVAGRMRIKTSESEYPSLRLFDANNQLKSSFGPIDDDHITVYGLGGPTFTFNVVNGNIGIGTTSPAFKLDVVGRMRIMQDTSTAGIWFDGTANPRRSFIGTYNNDYFGFYGNGGASWGLVMNVNNGNFGVGTLSPTKRLDINGALRIRGSSPAKGNILTSQDNNGNATWAKASAFKVAGTASGSPQVVDNQTWTKVFFNLNPQYNVGNNYNPTNAEYVVNVKGIYNFKSNITFTEQADKHSIRIRLNRNGAISTIGEIYHQGYNEFDAFDDEDTVFPTIINTSANISAHKELLPGDKVWVEVFIDIYSGGGMTTGVSENHIRSWFSGKLISRTP